MEYCCNFCKKTFGNKGALGSHISFCNKNPDRRTKRSPQYYEAQKNKVYKKPVLKKEIKTCPFCKKTWETVNFGYTVHTQHCYKNPDRTDAPSKGRHISEETRKKLKANSGGYRKNAGRGKRGYYKGLYCMSSWELAWVVYQLEHGSNVQQCKERFEYIMDNETHHYTPDFIVNGVYYEIKNWHRPDTDFKISSFPKEKKLILIEGKDAMKPYIEYVLNKYGEEFWKSLYESED